MDLQEALDAEREDRQDRSPFCTRPLAVGAFAYGTYDVAAAEEDQEAAYDPADCFGDNGAAPLFCGLFGERGRADEVSRRRPGS